jgi:spore maturation protein CgeB
MQFALFYHSLISDWNHGNAHFLRGVVTELQSRGHHVRVFEPANGWSLKNLILERGHTAVREFSRVFPSLHTTLYDLETLDLDEALCDADVVLVHEWNDHELVRRIGLHRATHRYRLLFHDTHHRGVTDPASISKYDLRYFDGVLAFGEVLRELYVQNGWAAKAWTWHEAADTSVFRPQQRGTNMGDIAWIGNWGDDERTAELSAYFIQPVSKLGIRANVWGVRYPDSATACLRSADIAYHGWLPNYRAPEILCRHRAAIHIPRQPYVRALPGIPTIRVFEVLACGVALVSATWHDTEGLFKPGDFLMARTPEEMTRHLKAVVHDKDLAASVASSGLKSVLSRHTCKHRVDELLDIHRQLTGVEECALPSLGRA